MAPDVALLGWRDVPHPAIGARRSRQCRNGCFQNQPSELPGPPRGPGRGTPAKHQRSRGGGASSGARIAAGPGRLDPSRAFSPRTAPAPGPVRRGPFRAGGRPGRHRNFGRQRRSILGAGAEYSYRTAVRNFAGAFSQVREHWGNARGRRINQPIGVEFGVESCDTQLERRASL